MSLQLPTEPHHMPTKPPPVPATFHDGWALDPYHGRVAHLWTLGKTGRWYHSACGKVLRIVDGDPMREGGEHAKCKRCERGMM